MQTGHLSLILICLGGHLDHRMYIAIVTKVRVEGGRLVAVDGCLLLSVV